MSVFSAKFVAMKVCIAALEGLRFKLRMFGVPLPKGEPCHVLCNNKSVVKNTTNVESTLNKKHSQIAYHFSWWCVAAGIVTISRIDGKLNLKDVLTKRLPQVTQDLLFSSWAY